MTLPNLPESLDKVNTGFAFNIQVFYIIKQSFLKCSITCHLLPFCLLSTMGFWPQSSLAFYQNQLNKINNNKIYQEFTFRNYKNIVWFFLWFKICIIVALNDVCTDCLCAKMNGFHVTCAQHITTGPLMCPAHLFNFYNMCKGDFTPGLLHSSSVKHLAYLSLHYTLLQLTHCYFHL